MRRYDLSRIAFYSMTREELWAARRLRQLELRILRRLRRRLALRLHGATYGGALAVIVVGWTAIFLANRLLPGQPWFVIIAGGGVGTAVILAAASSEAIERRLQEMRVELDEVVDRIAMHQDSLRALERHLRKADQASDGAQRG